MAKSKDDYDAVEAQRRFEQALKGAAKAPPKKRKATSTTTPKQKRD